PPPPPPTPPPPPANTTAQFRRQRQMCIRDRSVPAIGEIRTTGAMMAIEFTDPETGEPLQELSLIHISEPTRL
ncbi:hypothetical protein ACRTEE_23330, partial [Vibrio alginolyticus]